MAFTIDSIKQGGGAGGYITQVYEKEMKPRAKEDDPKAREVKESEQPQEYAIGQSAKPNKGRSEDAVVVDVSQRRAEEVVPPSREEEPPQVEEPVEEEKPKEEIKSTDVEA